MLIEESIFAENSTNVIRVKPVIEFDFAGILVFPGIFDLNYNIFNTFNVKD